MTTVKIILSVTKVFCNFTLAYTVSNLKPAVSSFAHHK